MKKLFISFITILLLMSTAKSEDVLRPKGKSSMDNALMPANNQTPFYFGLEIGANYNIFSPDMNWEPQIFNSPLSVLEEGSGLSFYAGVYFEIPFADNQSIHTKIQYSNYSFGNEKNTIGECIIFDEFGNAQEIRAMDLRTEYDQSINFVVIEPLYKLFFVDDIPIFFMIGPSIQFGVGTSEATFSQTILDEDCFFTDEFGNQTQFNSVTTTDDYSEIRLGLNFSLGYEYYVDGFVIAPQLHFSLMPTSIFEDESVIDDTRPNLDGESVLSLTNQNLNSIRFSIAVGLPL